MKKCKACSKEFTPLNSLQKTCSLDCELLLTKQKKAKKKKSKTKKTKSKYQTVLTLKKECATAFQLLRRLECADNDGFGTCPTSGNRIHWTKGDGGHCVPRGITETLFDPRNVYLQSSYDNAWEMGRLSVIERFFDYIASIHGPEVVEELKEKEKAKRTVKWSRLELVEMLADYDARIEAELIRVGGTDPRSSRVGLWADREWYLELMELNRAKIAECEK